MRLLVKSTASGRYLTFPFPVILNAAEMSNDFKVEAGLVGTEF